jgi:hypothetical protein
VTPLPRGDRRWVGDEAAVVHLTHRQSVCGGQGSESETMGRKRVEGGVGGHALDQRVTDHSLGRPRFCYPISLVVAFYFPVFSKGTCITLLEEPSSTIQRVGFFLVTPHCTFMVLTSVYKFGQIY